MLGRYPVDQSPGHLGREIDLGLVAGEAVARPVTLDLYLRVAEAPTSQAQRHGINGELNRDVAAQDHLYITVEVVDAGYRTVTKGKV